MQPTPTYRILNKILTLCGCERRAFLAALYIGLGVFLSISSVVAGFVTFMCFATLGWYQAQDPVRLRVLFNPGRYRAVYDAAARNPFPVRIYAESGNRYRA